MQAIRVTPGYACRWTKRVWSRSVRYGLGYWEWLLRMPLAVVRAKNTQKNIDVQLHALRKNDIHHKKQAKKILAPAPASDLNTLVLHGAPLFFVASL